MYVKLAIMSVLSFIAMYILMYAMVDTLADAYLSATRAYMAASMTAPMLIFAILIMGSMYKNKKANIAILVGGLVLLVVAVYAMRDQTAINETQFLRSMIPHHSSAILMCENPRLQEQQVKDLCAQIIESQKSEIEEMNVMLAGR
ncbi:MAG: DUF305 domain-containing protein [Pyrinomonadaceae bacterium]|nr:DUF305 domain-containing protein [Pyrinomonadaceae bacterium]